MLLYVQIARATVACPTFITVVIITLVHRNITYFQLFVIPTYKTKLRIIYERINTNNKVFAFVNILTAVYVSKMRQMEKKNKPDNKTTKTWNNTLEMTAYSICKLLKYEELKK